MRHRRLTGSPASEIEDHPSEIWVYRGRAPRMERSHRHDDLELNYVVRGRLEYLFGGSPLTVEAGQIALFWAATPHRLIDETPDQTSDTCWVHIPLSTVFGWRLPSEHLGDLLRTRPIVLPAESAGRDPETMFESWLTDLTGGATAEFALLEIHALVLRLLHWHLGSEADPHAHAEPPQQPAADAMRHVSEMAQYAVNHFRQDITAADVARASHLNANYAMALFRSTVGSTIGEYLTRCRVAEAQRLLLTTTMTTSEIAPAAGFGSQSSFYAHFSKVCGRSPSAYRRARWS